VKKRARILNGLALSLDLFPEEKGKPATAWHQIALEGKWQGHWQGPFSLDGKILEQMVEHRAASPIDTVVDYEHSSIFGGENAPAAGWIKSLETRKAPDGAKTLWAQIEWTERAADHIRAREYRYVSPTILFNTRDRKSGGMTGASLHSLALTNKPFLTELPELRVNSAAAGLFTDLEENDAMNEAQFKRLCQALGLSDTATADQALDAVGRISQSVARSAMVCSELGLQPSATDQDVQGAILKLKAPPAVSAADFAALQSRLAERDANDAVARALADRKLQAPGTPHHAWALDFARKDLGAFNAWAAAAPALVALGQKVPPPPKPGEDAETEDEKRACAQLGMSIEDYRKCNQRGDAIRNGSPIASPKGA
jgi:phage I-like protein